MVKSESILKIAPALLRAQKNVGSATKGSKNPFFKSTYADLGSVMEACKDALNSEGITVLQPAYGNETGHYVETVLLHESGEFISDGGKRLELKNPTMQELGSAETYGRRYGLQAMVFVPSEDDDAEGSMKRVKTAVSKAVNELTVEPVYSVVNKLSVTTNEQSNNEQLSNKTSSFRKPATTTSTTKATPQVSDW